MGTGPSLHRNTGIGAFLALVRVIASFPTVRKLLEKSPSPYKSSVDRKGPFAQGPLKLFFVSSITEIIIDRSSLICVAYSISAKIKFFQEKSAKRPFFWILRHLRGRFRRPTTSESMVIGRYISSFDAPRHPRGRRIGTQRLHWPRGLALFRRHGAPHPTESSTRPASNVAPQCRGGAERCLSPQFRRDRSTGDRHLSVAQPMLWRAVCSIVEPHTTSRGMPASPLRFGASPLI